MTRDAILTHPRLKLFLALSRTPHGVIDIATPALAALLCLGHFPSLVTILLGLVTVFAGYTAVYALNDLVDYRADRQKVHAGGYGDGEDYLDGVLVRHPLAKGVLTLPEGMLWAGGWALVAMAGAWLLNPVCLYIFLAGGLLEALYCSLWRVTPLRALINGIVKALGALAAVYAVNPQPSIIFLIVLFGWIFFWEIGGQNIPNDWTDIEEDRRFKAKTIPVKLGLARAGLLALTCLVAAFFLTFLLMWISPLYLRFHSPAGPGRLGCLAAIAASPATGGSQRPPSGHGPVQQSQLFPFEPVCGGTGQASTILKAILW